MPHGLSSTTSRLRVRHAARTFAATMQIKPKDKTASNVQPSTPMPLGAGVASAVGFGATLRTRKDWPPRVASANGPDRIGRHRRRVGRTLPGAETEPAFGAAGWSVAAFVGSFAAAWRRRDAEIRDVDDDAGNGDAVVSCVALVAVCVMVPV